MGADFLARSNQSPASTIYEKGQQTLTFAALSFVTQTTPGYDRLEQIRGYSETVTVFIISGVPTTDPFGPAPRLIASTTSIPSVTRPTTVYWPFRK